MKTWITYLATGLFGFAATLLLKDYAVVNSVFSYIAAFVLQLGGFILVPFLIFSFTSGIASIRKDGIGKQVSLSVFIWSCLSGLALIVLGVGFYYLFPSGFPITSTAGLSNDSLNALAMTSIASNLQKFNFSNPMMSILTGNSFILPLILVCLLFGIALKPSSSIVRPAYVTMNSFSEVMYRIGRYYSYVAHFFLFFFSYSWCIALWKDGTIFISFRYFLSLLALTAAALFIVLPLVYAILTGFRRNPYIHLYRMFAPNVYALFSANMIATLPITMTLSRYNMGTQKRLSSTVTPLFSIFGRCGTGMVSVFTICGIIEATTGSLPPLNVIIPLAVIVFFISALSSFFLGTEIVFLVYLTFSITHINLYGSETAIIGLLPLLNGIAVMLDTVATSLGTSYCANFVKTEPDVIYKDIV